MTDERDLLASISRLEAGQRKIERSLRRTLLLLTLTLGAFTLADQAIIWWDGGQWAVRDLILTGTLGIMGLSGCYAFMVCHRILIAAHAQLADSLRSQAALIVALSAAEGRR